LFAFCLGIALVAIAITQTRLVLDRERIFYPGGETPIGADLLVFYGAGRSVTDGDGEQLYDPAR